MFLFLVFICTQTKAQVKHSGNSIQLSGLNQYLSLGTSLNNISFPKSFCFWVNQDLLKNNQPYFSTSEGFTGYTGLWSNTINNILRGHVGNGSSFTTSGRYSQFSNRSNEVNDWTFVSIVYSASGNISLYVEGVLISSYFNGAISTISQPLLCTSSIGRLFNGSGYYYYKGEMDEFSIWDKELSALEIRKIMCGKIQGNEVGLRSCYNLDNLTSNTFLDIGSAAVNGINVGGMSNTSGAPIGDISHYQYSNSQNFNVTLFGNLNIEINYANTNEGIQVYEVNQVPNNSNGIPNNLNFNKYFGVFAANTTKSSNTFSIKISNVNPTDSYFVRESNESLTWTTASTAVSGNDIIISGLDYRSEVLIAKPNTTNNCRLELGNDLEICLPSSIWLKDQFYNSSKKYIWNGSLTQDSIQIISPGWYVVEMDSAGCIKQDSVFISEKTNIPPVFDDIEKCNTDTLEYRFSVGNYHFLWPNGHQDSTVTITNENDLFFQTISECFDTTAHRISITQLVCEKEDCTLYIPDAFTPNDDLKNDHFLVKSNCTFKSFEIHIFNRWGNQVYQSLDQYFKWDASIPEDVQEGTYVYIIYYQLFSGRHFEKQGYVTVLH